MLNPNYKKIDLFCGNLLEHLEQFPLTPKQAKIIQHQLKCEHSRLSIFILNARYTFCKHSDYRCVPTEVKEFLEFLQNNQHIIDWNSLYMAVETIWRE